MNCQVLEMPYIGRKMSMVIYLPKEINGLAELEEQMQTSQPQNTKNLETDAKNLEISVKIVRLIDRQTKPSKHRF